tara:strand:+ start:207 stop:1232 length:1026 start_codon:yes stop_codon:yes gene_type:complete
MFKLPPYVEKKNTDGIYRYRRRIPVKLVEIVGKVRFYRNLGRGKDDIVSKWTTVHREYEALIAQAKDTLALQQEMSAEAKAEYEKKSERDKVLFLVEQHYGKEASEMLSAGGVIDKNFESALMGLADDLHGRIAPETEAILYSGKVHDAVITLVSAIDGYYAYKTTGIPETDKRLHNRLMANKRNLIKCWGAVKVEKTPIEQLTRRDANAYRDFLLETTKPSSVSRNISTISAVINWNARENGLDVSSPFNNIIIKDSAHTKDDRHPLTTDEVIQVNGVMKDTTVWPLWVMMRDLGMRTAEVSGLLVGDILLQNRLVDIKANVIRCIKTDGSERTLPLSKA